MFNKLKESAHALRTETIALYLACRNPRTPWAARALALLVVAYALSPIDLVPDFIPVLGYLDDLILLPLGITLAIRMIPPEAMAEARETAKQAGGPGGNVGRIGAALVALVWLAILAGIAWSIIRLVRKA